jgi:hypothetical protein
VRTEKDLVTMRRSNRKATRVTGLFDDLASEARDVVDNALDRASDVESDAGRVAQGVVAGEGRWSRSRSSEIHILKTALDELAAKVERLAAAQTEDEGERRSS